MRALAILLILLLPSTAFAQRMFVTDQSGPGGMWTEIQCQITVPKNPPFDGQQVDTWCGIAPNTNNLIVQTVLVWSGSNWFARAEYYNNGTDRQIRINVSPGDHLDMVVSMNEIGPAAFVQNPDGTFQPAPLITTWYANVFDERSGASTAPFFVDVPHSGDERNYLYVEQELHNSSCADAYSANVTVQPAYANQLNQPQFLSFPFRLQDVSVATEFLAPHGASCSQGVGVATGLVQFTQ